jgi:uncharacterized protein (TIGR03084 family)
VELIDDLLAEHAALDDIVSTLVGRDWERPTPAEPWTVRDQLAHLIYFDAMARLALTDRTAFEAERESTFADPDRCLSRPLEARRTVPPDELLAEWRSGRAALTEAFRTAGDGLRVPWYGPDMGVRSFATARLMETWAHGQDIVDALGRAQTPTARLRHIADLGVRTRRFSYLAHGRPAPEGEVRVELTGPGGVEWSWGPVGSDEVRGPALDFCLVVTQRRHLADVRLITRGPAAVEWLAIAQCFAGPAGQGRQPGQFSG